MNNVQQEVAALERIGMYQLSTTSDAFGYVTVGERCYILRRKERLDADIWPTLDDDAEFDIDEVEAKTVIFSLPLDRHGFYELYRLCRCLEAGRTIRLEDGNTYTLADMEDAA